MLHIHPHTPGQTPSSPASVLFGEGEALQGALIPASPEMVPSTPQTVCPSMVVCEGSAHLAGCDLSSVPTPVLKFSLLPEVSRGP